MEERKRIRFLKIAGAITAVMLLFCIGVFFRLQGELHRQAVTIQALSETVQALSEEIFKKGEETPADFGDSAAEDKRGVFSEAVGKTRGTAVGIAVYETVTVHQSGTSFSDPLSKETQKKMQIGHASGVVVGKERVLTCYHVVKDADTIRVRVSFANGEEQSLEAELLEKDAVFDLAVLSVPGLTAEAAILGDSDRLREGDMIFCISNTASEKLSASVTTGVVSGLGRTAASANVKEETVTLFQTDAAINGGSSGGGIFNLSGELVGIVARKFVGSVSSDTQLEGIGMCIPINEAKNLLAKAGIH